MPENTSPASDESGRGDEVYQPAGADSANRPSGPLDPENALDTDPEEDPEEPGYSPPDRAFSLTGYGTTVREAREGAPLDERLAEERPDQAPPPGNGVGDLPDGEGEPMDEESGAVRAGRLLSPDDPVAAGGGTAVDAGPGPDEGAAPAEEAAVHRDTGIDGGTDAAADAADDEAI
ncbi:DUF5709 domain-containing protein [Streptomyces sp. NPDC003943]